MAIYDVENEGFDHTYCYVNILNYNYRITLYGELEYIFLKVQSIKRSIPIHYKKMTLPNIRGKKQCYYA